MKKLLMLVALLSVGPRWAMADNTVSLPVVGSLDLTNFLHNAGVVDTYDNHGVNRAGAAVRALWYPNDTTNPSAPADNAYVGLEGIVSWDTATGAAAGVGGWLGFRLDTLAGKLFGPAPKIGYTTVPNIEFGPMGMFVNNNPSGQKWVYGAAIAKHF